MAKKIKKIIKNSVNNTNGESVRLLNTRVPGLDKLLGGGIPEGSSFVVFSPPHSGKKPLLMKIAYSSLLKNRPVIFILTDFGAVNWQNMMKSSGWNIDKNKEIRRNFYVIDCYSQQFGTCPSTETVKCMEVPYTLSQISITATDFLDTISAYSKRKPIVIIHSLSTLIENFGEDSVFRFMQFFMGKLRTDGITFGFSLQSEVHEDKTAKLLTGLADGIIELKGRQIRVSGFTGAPADWYDYILSKEGVAIKLPKQPKLVKQSRQPKNVKSRKPIKRLVKRPKLKRKK